MSQYYKTKSYDKIFYRLLWIVITNNTKKKSYNLVTSLYL